LQPVLVQASENKLHQRLLQRGRETVESIELRLQRGEQFNQVSHPNLIYLNNDAELEESVQQLVSLLRRHD